MQSFNSNWIVNQNSAIRVGTSEFSQNQEDGWIHNVATALLERPLKLEPETVGLEKDKIGNIPQDKGVHLDDIEHFVARKNIVGISGESMKLFKVKVKGVTQLGEDHMIDFLGRGPKKIMITFLHSK